MDLELKELVTNELDRVFKETFRLTDKDIKAYIQKILDEEDESTVLELTDIFVKFEKYDDKGKYSVARSKAARLVLNRCLDIYFKDKEKIKTNFFNALDFAQKFEIDPFKISTKENLRNLNSYLINETYFALTQIEYTNPITSEKFKLFNQKDFKELIENCASIICHINRENVEKVVSILNCFAYDAESKSFKARPEQMLKMCGSLLTFPSAKLESNIKFLKNKFVPPMKESELIERISKSPSILMCDQNKIKNFENCIYKNLCQLREISPVLFPEGERFEEFAKNFTDNATFKIDKLSSISGLTKENIDKFSETKDVLVKYLGAKNALEIFTDFNVLSVEPKILGALLSKLTAHDNENNTFLRKYFVEHTARALNMLKEDELPSDAPSKKLGRTYTIRRIKADVSSMPNQSDDEFYLTSHDKKTVNNLFENVKQTFELRKQRKIVNGVEQLSEEEQEEQEYMKEVFDRIQDSFDATKCDSTFDEIVSRMQLMIDAKEGKGYANKRFAINEIKHLNKVYLSACQDSKALCEKLIDAKIKFQAVKMQIPVLLDCSGEVYIEACKNYISAVRNVLPLLEKIDDIHSTVSRFVNKEYLKVFQALKMPNDENPDKNGDSYYDTEWFGKYYNSSEILLGLSIGQAQLSYTKFLDNYLKTIIPDYDNANYKMAIDNLACEEINLKYLIYAHRLRASIAPEIINVFYSLYKTMVDAKILSEHNSKIELNIHTIFKIQNDIDNYFSTKNLSSVLLGENREKFLTTELNKNLILQKKCLSALLESHCIYQRGFDKIDKLLDKNKIDDFHFEHDCIGKMYHTDGGLIIFPPTESGEFGYFMSQPEIRENLAKIEKLGVEKIIPSKYDNVDIIIGNYTFNQEIFTKTDEKNILPVKFDK